MAAQPILDINKGGLISEGIFYLVSSLKDFTKWKVKSVWTSVLDQTENIFWELFTFISPPNLAFCTILEIYKGGLVSKGIFYLVPSR